MRTARVIFNARLLVYALAATVTAVSVGLVARHTNQRLDLTSTGSHRLGERTRARLDGLDTPVELVLAVDRSRLDLRARDRVEDVLATFAHASPRVGVTIIDTGAPAGPAQYGALRERLAEREAPARQRRAQAAAAIIDHARALADRLPRLDAAARTAGEVDPAGAARLTDIAAFARVAARQVREAVDPEDDPAGAVAPGEPGADARTIASLAGDIAPRLGTIADELARAMPDAPTDEARLRVRDAQRMAAALRDEAALVAQMGTGLVTLDSERIESALATGEAALLIGPPRDGAPGVVAIDLNELFPPAAYFQAAGLAGEIETAAQAERLIANALTVLTDPARPIVVFVHGEIQRWVGRAGIMTGLLERLGRAGIDHAEWAPVIDEREPDLTELDPAGERPAVYVFISPDSSAASAPGNPASRPGADRAEIVGRALESLLERGAPVLVNLNPSVFPTFGDDDPIAAPLERLGIRVSSATPVLRETAGPAGRATTVTHRLVPGRVAGLFSGQEPHPIAEAVAGLPFTLDWPLPVAVDDPATPVLALGGSDDTWAEDDWLGFWRTPRNQRALLSDPPVFDADADARGPWTIAAAARGSTETGRRTRAVVVGSNAWFLDRMWRSQQLVGGRPVLTNPGNVELFDAAVLWLAGRDELIAASPTARPIARIGPVSEGGLLALRWGLIAGLPLVILAAGGIWHALRR